MLTTKFKTSWKSREGTAVVFEIYNENGELEGFSGTAIFEDEDGYRLAPMFMKTTLGVTHPEVYKTSVEAFKASYEKHPGPQKWHVGLT